MTHAGEIAETACVGFGLERFAIVLLRHHGEPETWAAAINRALPDA